MTRLKCRRCGRIIKREERWEDKAICFSCYCYLEDLAKKGIQISEDEFPYLN
jgi:hypothetical protein